MIKCIDVRMRIYVEEPSEESIDKLISDLEDVPYGIYDPEKDFELMSVNVNIELIDDE